MEILFFAANIIAFNSMLFIKIFVCRILIEIKSDFWFMDIVYSQLHLRFLAA